MTPLTELLKRYWGYENFRPLQRETIEAIQARRDSLTILPTGGGKSLCYQLPALLFEDRTAVVVSPLIALMQDQVDTARELGLAADLLNSSLSNEAQQAVLGRLKRREIRLLYVSPERLANPDFLNFLRFGADISFFAIDEAHCISQWGHDFRPEYRAIGRLREYFPENAIHAFTATATPQVRQDILHSLNLRDPIVQTGSFLRPNLHYQVRRAPTRGESMNEEISAWVANRPDDGGIIYCTSRREVDEMAARLSAQGLKVHGYHAGLSDETRQRRMSDFMNETVNVMVATVAFGMGIDRPDIRYVLHTGLPKSVEHYQQEAGRAGRDGLDADCVLYFRSKDVFFWNDVLRQGGGDGMSIGLGKLNDMVAYAHTGHCRHRFLVEYFGQAYEGQSPCGSCDNCLNPSPSLPDSETTAKKILSCVWRLGEKSPARYTAQVLLGSREEKILEARHDQLSTFGLLQREDKQQVACWIEELVAQGLLRRESPYGALKISPSGKAFLKGEPVDGQPVQLSAPESGGRRPAKDRQLSAATSGLSPLERELFERLRARRRILAQIHEVPPFVIFNDMTLRDMARQRPTTEEAMRRISGVGRHKLEAYGEAFLEEIREVVGSRVVLDEATPEVRKIQRQNTREVVFALLDERSDLDTIRERIDRAPSTVVKYLLEYVEARQLTQPEPWLSSRALERVRQAVALTGSEKLRILFDALDQDIDFNDIRLALVLLKNQRLAGVL
jgi:ATP-dependent DNA helicase RecQ